MDILFFANLIPFPLDGGGKIFTYSVLKALSKDNNIDLICFYEHEDVEKARKELMTLCNSITVLPIKVTTSENIKLMMAKAIGSLGSTYPLGVKKYITSEMKSALHSIMNKKKYACAFFNILAMYAYAPIVKEIDNSIKTVLYEQNCEALIYERYFKETSNFMKKIFLQIESSKLKRFEQNSINSCDQLILLSKEDQKALGVSNQKCSVIPIGIDPVTYQKNYFERVNGVLKMLFVGTMTWSPNNEGIVWFLENVMPLYADNKKYELYIVGKNPSEKVQRLCAKYNNVQLMGYVDSVEDYYKKCDILIVPLFIGSGQRVKIIEAFSRGFVAVSTTIGVEGLYYRNGDTILIADSKEEFKIQIDRCFDSSLLKKIGDGSKRVFEQEYSTDIIAKKLNQVIYK